MFHHGWRRLDASSGEAAGTGSLPPARGGLLSTPGGTFASATETMADKVAPEPNAAEQGGQEGGKQGEDSMAQRGSIVMAPSDELMAKLDRQVSMGVRSSVFKQCSVVCWCVGVLVCCRVAGSVLCGRVWLSGRD